MAKYKHIPYVMMGVNDKPNKGLVAYKSAIFPDMNAYRMDIVELKNEGQYEFGDTYNTKDITGVYMSIIFCNVKSVDAMIAELTSIKKHMEQAD